MGKDINNDININLNKKKKLKNVLIFSFLALTLIPIAFVAILLYKSGLTLSKESYMRNLEESINVQVDYITQTIENDMIYEHRFANRSQIVSLFKNRDSGDLLDSFQAYLESSEDRSAVCALLNSNDELVYSIGEKKLVDLIIDQLPEISCSEKQSILELKLKGDIYSLGIVTPVFDDDSTCIGRLVSVYDKSYLFKIISSYYKISNTSTYVSRQNGEVINLRSNLDDTHSKAFEAALHKDVLHTEGVIDSRIDGINISGYYKAIDNTPWYLAAFIDDSVVFSFANQFILVYILIIVGVLFADVLLSFYISKRVIKPINALIGVMERYQNSLDEKEFDNDEKNSYFETQYLKNRFVSLMKKIMLVQHNFEGMYHLYESSDMDDTNIDIDVKRQTATSNKEAFQILMNEVKVSQGACVVEKFVNCFCEKDMLFLMEMLEGMRDHHLSVTREAEVYTPYLNQKWFHVLVVPMYENDRLSRLFVQLRDISSFKLQEKNSFELARRDQLTGLYNRTGFTEQCNKLLDSSTDSDMHAVLFIDMNYFKLVNDNFGHAAGDNLLCSIANDIQESIGVADVASRFGGDEFAILLTNTSPKEMGIAIEGLTKRLVYPYKNERIEFIVSASVGSAIWNDSNKLALHDLLHIADNSMYEVKRDFKSTK